MINNIREERNRHWLRSPLVCNGANCKLVVRFDGILDSNLDKVDQYIYWGFFYRYNDSIILSLDDFDAVIADSMRVISIEPVEDEDEE